MKQHFTKDMKSCFLFSEIMMTSIVRLKLYSCEVCMKNAKIRFGSFILIFLIGIFGIINFSKHKTNEDIGVFSNTSSENFSVEITSLSDKRNSSVKLLSQKSEDEKKCWGIKRGKGGAIPSPDPGTPELLKRYNALFLGNSKENKIYLTFDEGYENGYTEKILNTLFEKGVKAIFFITGPYLKEQSMLVKRMVNEGHEVGNHTIHHPSLPEKSDDLIDSEVNDLNQLFNEGYGQNMRFLRPPKGEYSQRELEITSKLGYCNLFWSFAYDDWYRDKIRGASYAREIVKKNLHYGAVLLLHAVSKDNADALADIIDDAKNLGYEFGTPNELFDLSKNQT